MTNYADGAVPQPDDPEPHPSPSRVDIVHDLSVREIFQALRRGIWILVGTLVL